MEEGSKTPFRVYTYLYIAKDVKIMLMVDCKDNSLVSKMLKAQRKSCVAITAVLNEYVLIFETDALDSMLMYRDMKCMLS